MTLTTRRIITAVAEEAAEGVAETLVLADTIETKVSPSLNPNIETIEREVSGGSLTEPEDVAGRSSGVLDIPMELAGPSDGDPTSSPTWTPFQSACGMRPQAAEMVVVASVTTPGGTLASRFSNGEVITFTGSGATGTVVGEFDARGKTIGSGIRMTQLFYTPLVGSVLAGDTAVTGTSGTVMALQTTDNGLRDAIAWSPFDLLLKTQATGTITGTFTANELVTGDAGGRARVHIGTGTTPLVYEVMPGSAPFASGENLTGASSGATCATSAAATNYAIPSLTIARMLLGSEKQIYGARGNFSLAIANGQALNMTYQMTGKHSKPTEGIPPAGAPNARNARPPKVTGSSVFFDGYYAPCFQSMTVNSQHDVSLRECVKEETGFDSAIITGRKFRGSIDPETVAEGIFPLLGNGWDKTSWYTEIIMGDPTLEDGNAFVLRMPRTQATSYTDGDRNGIPISTIPLKFAGAGGGEDEFFLFQY